MTIKVEYIDHMGSDNFIANVARVSFGADGDFSELPEGYTVERRDGLLGFLGLNGHWTPFAHPQVCMRLRAPVPIRTQCFKHKIGFVENEESRRYISTTPTIYVPEAWRCKPDGSIKQGSVGVHEDNEDIARLYQETTEALVAIYEDLIAQGVAPEQARFFLPQGTEVNWVWTGSLAAWARVYRQRVDGHAQKEVQDIANEIDKILRPLFPVAWSKLVDD